MTTQTKTSVIHKTIMAALLTAPLVAVAQDYPKRPITLIIPYAARQVPPPTPDFINEIYSLIRHTNSFQFKPAGAKNALQWNSYCYPAM